MKMQIDVLTKADDIKKTHWIDEDATVAQLKGRCLEGCKEILEQYDVTWDELRTDRDRKTFLAKQHVCAFIHLCLFDVMSEVDMAEMTGIKRTSFRYCRVTYFEKHREPSAT